MPQSAHKVINISYFSALFQNIIFPLQSHTPREGGGKQMPPLTPACPCMLRRKKHTHYETTDY